MKLAFLSIVFLSVFTVNASHINRSKDHHKIHHSKSLKWTKLEQSEQIGGVNMGKVSLTRGESYRRRGWHNKESLDEDLAREFFQHWIHFKSRYSEFVFLSVYHNK